MAEIVKLLGPPGTGKTTTLLEYVEKEMESLPIENIGYFLLHVKQQMRQETGQ